jgi:hypothetical protein
MATTDAKSGFRLPWSADRNESDTQVDEVGGESASDDPAQATSQHETPTMTDTASSSSETASDPSSAAAPSAESPVATSPAPATRKPNKFMADLTKAMQAAAEAARADTLERFGAEAKAHIESIHASTADEATDLRKKADDDIASIREWSKAEIARIREETDERITHRKDVLEREIEAHAGQIEARIERVQQRVAGFEGQMQTFFDRLFAEEDPTRFASMAESLPEPPPFDADSAWTDVPAAAGSSAATAVAEAPVDSPVADDAPSDAEPDTEGSAEASADASAEIDAPEMDTSSNDGLIGVESSDDSVSDWGAPAAETEAVTETETAPERTPAVEDSGDLFGIANDPAPPAEQDPRLSALGLDPDFAAAEAEAGSFPVESQGSDDEIPVIADDALAARLAGLVPETEPSGESATTRVVVTGLVSVASIAGFKRNLARASGVHSVGVSSGPDGEFVFSVKHDAAMALGESIATLPGFGARVTDEAPGELTVAARDPEAEG